MGPVPLAADGLGRGRPSDQGMPLEGARGESN